MQFGAAYYPEPLPESRWPRDIALMKQANFTVVRLGEFAWSTMEPKEGEYAFDWLDKAVALLDKAGIDVVMGTPTAAPPACSRTPIRTPLRLAGTDGRPNTAAGATTARSMKPTSGSAGGSQPRWPSDTERRSTSSAGRSTTNTT